MNRIVFLVAVALFVLSGCSGPQGPRLNGVFSGVVYSSGYAIGAMGVDLETSGSELSGVSCFVGLDYREACNYVSGSLLGTDASFRIGGLRFTGKTDGTYIDTTFRSDDATVAGRVYFTRSTSTQSLSVPQGSAEARDESENFLEHFTATYEY